MAQQRQETSFSPSLPLAFPLALSISLSLALWPRLCVNVWLAFGRQAWQIALLGWQPGSLSTLSLAPHAWLCVRFYSSDVFLFLPGPVFFSASLSLASFLFSCSCIILCYSCPRPMDDWLRRRELHSRPGARGLQRAVFVSETDSHDRRWKFLKFTREQAREFIWTMFTRLLRSVDEKFGWCVFSGLHFNLWLFSVYKRQFFKSSCSTIKALCHEDYHIAEKL